MEFSDGPNDKLNDSALTEEELLTGVPAKKKLKKYLLSILFMAALIAVTLYVIFKDNSASDIMGVLKSANLWWVGAGVLAMVVCRTFQALSMGMAARCIGYRLTLWEMLRYAFVGVFYGGITPLSAGGQPMQFFYMCRDKMTLSGATLVMLSVNIMFQLSLVLVGTAMFIFKYSYVMSVENGFALLLILSLAAHFAFVLMLAAVMFSEKLLLKFISAVVGLLTRVHIIKDKEKTMTSVDKYLSEVKRGTELIRAHPGPYALVLLFILGHVTIYHLVPYFVYLSFGMDTGFSCMDIAALSLLLFIAVSILPLPGTVGASERGFVVLYRAAFPGQVLAATLLSRFINFYLFLVIAGVIASIVQLRRPHNLEVRRKPGSRL